jgi:hypothetical protein
MPDWRADYLGKKGSHLGTVESPYEKSAIEQAWHWKTPLR